MKRYMMRMLTLALAVCLCLSMATPASAKVADVPVPGMIDIDMTVTPARQVSGDYRVSYKASMTMLDELAKFATLYRHNDLMFDLRFVCTLNDTLVTQLTSVGKDDFTFSSAKWQGTDIFVYEDAEVTSEGLKLYYKLDEDVIRSWRLAMDEDVKASLLQPMQMVATKTVTLAQLQKAGNPIHTTGTVELKGAGIEAVYGQYTIVGAEGEHIWYWGDGTPGGGSQGGGHGSVAPDCGASCSHCCGCCLRACPRNIFCPAGHFEDLDLQLWYHDGIHFCVEHGLMIGTAKYTFEPYLPITRGMVVTMLYRMEGEPAVSGAQIYDDVELDKWYADPVEWADSCGVVNGYGGDKFGPNDPITREQMAAVLYRYAKLKGQDLSAGENTNILSYKDAEDVSNYAVTAMQWACGAGLIEGSSGNLMPLAYTTRAQAATIFMRYCLKIGW